MTELYTMSAVTISTTEISIISGTSSLQTDTTAGVFALLVDGGNMAKGDEFRVRVYEKVLSGSTKKVIAQWTMAGVQAENFMTIPFPLLNGWDMTIIKMAGTDRAFSASIRQF